MPPDRIPVFHWQVALAEELRAAQNARWAAEDAARQKPVKAPVRRAAPAPSARKPPKAAVAPATPQDRAIPEGFALVRADEAKEHQITTYQIRKRTT